MQIKPWWAAPIVLSIASCSTEATIAPLTEGPPQVESSSVAPMDGDRHRPSPRATSRASGHGGEPVGAVVKWFNSSKGFGFVELTDGTGDVFLYMNTVEEAGLSDLAVGTQLQVRLGQESRGRQINAIVAVGPAVDGTHSQPRN